MCESLAHNKRVIIGRKLLGGPMQSMHMTFCVLHFFVRKDAV